jgi:uncharacterized membrane protein
MSNMNPGSLPPPTTPSGGVAGSDRTMMLVLSYLGILALIPLLMKKDDREIQWHAKNGLVFFAAEIIIMVVLALSTQVPFLGCVTWAIWCVMPLVFLVVAILAIMKALKGERFVIPGVSDFADKF